MGKDGFGGDCGMFALALADYIHKNSDVPVEIVLIGDSNKEDDYEWGEAELYHAAVKFGKRFADAGGETTVKDLFKFASEEYGDKDPAIFTVPYDAKNRKWLEKVVRAQTDYSYAIPYFSGLAKRIGNGLLTGG